MSLTISWPGSKLKGMVMEWMDNYLQDGSGTAYVSLTSIGDDWHQLNHFDLLWNHGTVSQKMWSYCLCPYCKCVCNVLSGTLIVLQILAVPISIVEVFCPLLPIVFWLVWNYSGFLLFPKYSPINTKTGFRSFLNHPCLSLTMSYHVLPCLTMSYHVLPCLTMSYHVLPCLTMSYHVLPCLTHISSVIRPGRSSVSKFFSAAYQQRPA